MRASRLKRMRHYTSTLPFPPKRSRRREMVLPSTPGNMDLSCPHTLIVSTHFLLKIISKVPLTRSRGCIHQSLNGLPLQKYLLIRSLRCSLATRRFPLKCLYRCCRGPGYQLHSLALCHFMCPALRHGCLQGQLLFFQEVLNSVSVHEPSGCGYFFEYIRRSRSYMFLPVLSGPPRSHQTTRPLAAHAA